MSIASTLGTGLTSAVAGAQNQLVTQAKQASSQLQDKTIEALRKRAGNKTLSQLTDAANRIQKGGLKAIDKNQIRNLAESKLADTIFKTGPKDDLLTVDVFGISDTGILNNLTDKMSGFAMSALDSFRKSPGLLTDLTSMIRTDNGGFSFDTKALTDRVMTCLGGGSNILRGLSTQLQGAITQGSNIDPAIYNRVEGMIGTAVQSFSCGNLRDARGIFDLVNQISGQSDLAEFFDVGAEANMLSGLFREAIQLGVPQAIEVLIEKANSDTAADYALRGNIEVAVTMADISTTTFMIDQLGINRILADVPDAAERLVSNYQIPAGTSQEQLDAERIKLTAILNQLAPNWRTYDRNGDPISDLSVFSWASEDALRLLIREPTNLIGATVASAYRPVSMLQQAKQMYPYAAV